MSDVPFGAVAERPSDAILRQTIRHRVEAAGTSFYWAMRLLPQHRRNAMYAVYAFCREVDDIADGERPVEYKMPPLPPGARKSMRSMPDIRAMSSPRRCVSRRCATICAGEISWPSLTEWRWMRAQIFALPILQCSTSTALG